MLVMLVERDGAFALDRPDGTPIEWGAEPAHFKHPTEAAAYAASLGLPIVAASTAAAGRWRRQEGTRATNQRTSYAGRRWRVAVYPTSHVGVWGGFAESSRFYLGSTSGTYRGVQQRLARLISTESKETTR
jgi:hypothetical protein